MACDVISPKITEHKELKIEKSKYNFQQVEDEELIRSKGLLQVLNEPFLLKEGLVEKDEDELEVMCLVNRNISLMESFSIMLLTELRVCNLSGNYIADLGPLRECTKLEKLDVSDNQVAHLPPKDFWNNLKQLKIMYLHGNHLYVAKELLFLGGCERLQILTAYDTPVSLQRTYRHTLVNGIPSLKALDDLVISDEEIIENFPLEGKFAAYSMYFKVNLYQITPPTASYESEMKHFHSLMATINQVYTHHSPVTIIQRYIRGWLTRKKLRLLGVPMFMISQKMSSKSSAEKLGRMFPQTSPTKVSFKREPNEDGLPKETKLLKSRVVKIGEKVIIKTSPRHSPRKQDRRVDVSHFQQASIIEDKINDKPSKQKVHIKIDIQLLQDSALSEEDPLSPRLSNKGQSSSPHSVNAAEKDKQEKEKDCALKRKTLGHQLTLLQDASSSTVSSSKPSETVESEVKEPESNTENASQGDMQVYGTEAEIQHHTLRFTLAESKKLDGQIVRNGEAEIEELKANHKAVPVTPRSDVLIKDKFDFRNVHGSMNFSTLDSIQKAYTKVLQQQEKRRQKVTIESRLREKNEAQRKIREYHLKKQEEIEKWKAIHKDLLARSREEACFERSLKSDIHSELVHQAQLQAKERTLEVDFVNQFNTLNSTLSDSLKKEDYRVRKESLAFARKLRVKQAQLSAVDAKTCLQSQLHERAEELKARGREDRSELMKEKHRVQICQLSRAKEKVNAVKCSLPAVTSRETHKVQMKYSQSREHYRIPLPLSYNKECVGLPHSPPEDDGNQPAAINVLNLAIDCGPPGSLTSSLYGNLPPSLILKHRSFEMECDNFVNPWTAGSYV